MELFNELYEFIKESRATDILKLPYYQPLFNEELDGEVVGSIIVIKLGFIYTDILDKYPKGKKYKLSNFFIEKMFYEFRTANINNLKFNFNDTEFYSYEYSSRKYTLYQTVLK